MSSFGVAEMEVSAENESPLPSNDLNTLFSLYSSYLYNRIRNLFPISINCTNTLLSKVANIYGYSGRGRRKTRLPLPLYLLSLLLLLLLLCPIDLPLERQAKSTGEWICLRQDIVDLANPGLQTGYKLNIVSQLKSVYDCLLPSSTRQ